MRKVSGAFVERYGYNGYGRPLIRESCGRGDFDQDTMLTSIDSDRMDEVYGATKWDPRADLDDDGDVDEVDYEMYTSDKYPLWSDDMSGPTVSSAFSDFGNWYLFQGVPHLALDTAAGATAGKLLLNHHRARYADPVTGRWGSRDPLGYDRALVETSPRLRRSIGDRSIAARLLAGRVGGRFVSVVSSYNEDNPVSQSDASGLCSRETACIEYAANPPPDDLEPPFIASGAGVVCCDGEKISCVWQNPPYDTNFAIVNCALAHEDTHHDDIRCPRCGMSRPGFRPDVDEVQQECFAYTVEADCLRDACHLCLQAPGFPEECADTCDVWSQREQERVDACNQ